MLPPKQAVGSGRNPCILRNKNRADPGLHSSEHHRFRLKSSIRAQQATWKAAKTGFRTRREAEQIGRGRPMTDLFYIKYSFLFFKLQK